MIPTTTTVSALSTARLYRDHVWKLHGLPTKFISDHRPQFAAEFTMELYSLIGVTPAKSTPYHPQTDGQTEQVNQELEQYLRTFVSKQQDDWADLLALAEFTYNNMWHSSIDMSPFMANYGYNSMFMDLFSVNHSSSAVESITNCLTQIQVELKASMTVTQEQHAQFYNAHHRDTPVFTVSNKV